MNWPHTIKIYLCKVEMSDQEKGPKSELILVSDDLSDSANLLGNNIVLHTKLLPQCDLIRKSDHQNSPDRYNCVKSVSAALTCKKDQCISHSTSLIIAWDL